MWSNLVITNVDVYSKPVVPKKYFSLEFSARGIIRKENKIALMHLANNNQFKLPGGRLKTKELPILGFRREIAEETGAVIKQVAHFGTIAELRTPNTKQSGKIFISYLFASSYMRSLGKTQLEPDEIKAGMRTIWIEPLEAIQLILSSTRIDYVSEFIFQRDARIVQLYLTKY